MSATWTGFRDPAVLTTVLSEQPGEWRRDTAWCARCACGHLDTEHRHDLLRTSPCHVGGCGCEVLRPVAVLWREHRVVEGVLPAGDAPDV